MAEKVFGIDIDGVVAKFLTDFTAYLSDRYKDVLEGRQVVPSDVRQWNFYEDIGLTTEQGRKAFGEFEEYGYFRHLEPVEGAISASNLIDGGYPLYYITHRSKRIAEDTRGWFREHMPWIDFDAQVFMKADKGEVCKDLGVTHFIDDRLENIQEVKEAGTPNVLLFNNYQNRDTDSGDIQRVGSWSEVLETWGLL